MGAAAFKASKAESENGKCLMQSKSGQCDKLLKSKVAQNFSNVIQKVP